MRDSALKLECIRYANLSYFKNGINVYEHLHPHKAIDDIALE